MSSNTFDWPNLAVFKGLPQNYLHLLARTETVERYEPRELIFHEGDEADRFFIIVEGTVAIEIFTNERGPVTIQTIGAGEILGWSWLVEPYRWHFDAQATAPTELIAFDASVVRGALDEYPDFGFAMMKRFLPIIVRRLQATRLQLLDIYHVHT